MTFSTSRLTAAAVAAGLLAALAGCSAHEPDDGAPLPPPPAESYQPAPPQPLAGAPPSAQADGLAGGPAAQVAPPTASMAPIANPEDLSAAERHRIYGAKYDRPGRHHVAGRAPGPHANGRHAHGQARASSRPTHYAAAAHPRAAPSRTAHPPAVRAPSTHAPVHAPVTPPATKSAAPKAPADSKPAATPVQAPAPHATPLDPKTARLQTALAAPVIAGAQLTAAPAIAEGQPGQVALSLPQNLADLVREQAAKAGLARAARSGEISATLSGTGYDIAPNGAQTLPLKAGVTPHFLWNVNPQPGVAHSRLHADVQAKLTGEPAPRAFPLASFEQAGAPATADSDKSNAGGLDGTTRTVLGVSALLGALILLLVLGNRAIASRDRARKRQAAATKAARAEAEADAARVRAAEAAATAKPPSEPKKP